MSGFTGISDYSDKLVAGADFYTVYFSKAGTSSIGSTYLCSLAQLAGTPEAVTLPSVGLGGAVSCSKVSPTGALYFPDAPAGSKWSIVKMEVDPLLATASQTPTFLGTFIIYDKLAHMLITPSGGSGSVNPALQVPARVPSGQGGQILCEVTTAFSSGNNQIYFTYTNQDGTSGRTTKTVYTRSSSAYTTAPISYPGTGTPSIYVDLQDGDTAVRSIDSFTLASGTVGGTMLVSLVQPIAVHQGGSFLGAAARDELVQSFQVQPIHNDAHLYITWIPNTSTTCSMNGSITFGLINDA